MARTTAGSPEDSRRTPDMRGADGTVAAAAATALAAPDERLPRAPARRARRELLARKTDPPEAACIHGWRGHGFPWTTPVSHGQLG
jgi:hypothetical protein